MTFLQPKPRFEMGLMFDMSVGLCFLLLFDSMEFCSLFSSNLFFLLSPFSSFTVTLSIFLVFLSLEKRLMCVILNLFLSYFYTGYFSFPFSFFFFLLQLLFFSRPTSTVEIVYNVLLSWGRPQLVPSLVEGAKEL